VYGVPGGAASVASDLLDLGSTAPADEENPWRSPSEMIHTGHPCHESSGRRGGQKRVKELGWVWFKIHVFWPKKWLSWILVNIKNILKY